MLTIKLGIHSSLNQGFFGENSIEIGYDFFTIENHLLECRYINVVKKGLWMSKKNEITVWTGNLNNDDVEDKVKHCVVLLLRCFGPYCCLLCLTYKLEV